MTVLEIILISGVVATILFFLGTIYFLLQFFLDGNKLKKLPKKKPKNKKKSKQLAKRRLRLLKHKKRCLTLFLVFLLLGLGTLGLSGYLSYYQATNLSSMDSNSVVKGHFLLQDFEEQVALAGNEEDEEEKLQKNIRYLATALASYNAKKASEVNSEEGQLALNRYYNSLKQLGMNASTQTKNFYGNPELVEEFKKDIARTQEYEKVVFEYFKVNESALAEE